MADVYGHAASNLVAGGNLESTIQQILDMGGGSWDRDTVVRALRAAFNNPERAVEYLYSVSSSLVLVVFHFMLFGAHPLLLGSSEVLSIYLVTSF